MFWGAHNYRPELFATVEPFVLIFFAMYLVIPILFATRQPPELKGLVDGTLVFGTPLSAAFMQAALVRDMPYGLAWSAGCAAALYAVLAVSVLRREGMRLLGETYIALAMVFATMAIFFALDAYPTFALWTLEGAAIVWVGLRQRRLLARLFGIALQFAGAWLFLLHYAEYSLDNPWFNDFVLGCALIAAAGAITSWLMHKHREVLIEGGESAATVLLVWACGWWFAGGLHALHDGLPQADFHASALIFAAASFALAETVGGWLAWNSLRLITHAHLPALVLGMVTIGSRHPLAGLGAVAWPLNFIVFFWCLHWQAHDGIVTVSGMRYRAGLGVARGACDVGSVVAVRSPPLRMEPADGRAGHRGRLGALSLARARQPRRRELQRVGVAVGTRVLAGIGLGLYRPLEPQRVILHTGSASSSRPARCSKSSAAGCAGMRCGGRSCCCCR